MMIALLHTTSRDRTCLQLILDVKRKKSQSVESTVTN